MGMSTMLLPVERQSSRSLDLPRERGFWATVAARVLSSSEESNSEVHLVETLVVIADTHESILEEEPNMGQTSRAMPTRVAHDER